MNLDNLQKMIDEKYISVQKHPTEDLFIYNYTQKAQFDRVWNEETMSCRGLIMDIKNNVVARPFKKFFNLEEAINQGEQLPIEDFEVTEKMDGSLGIMYFVGSTPWIATRGSFRSEQAMVGSSILHDMYADHGDMSFNTNWTYLFEIIYRENRIVVDYGDAKKLVLLAVVNTATGDEIGNENIPWFEKVKKYDAISDVSKLKELQEDNKEGFVIRYNSGKRYKVKFDEYIRLHRLVTGVNARTIWDLLRNNQPFDDLIQRVPDEFYDWVLDTRDSLTAGYKGIYIHAEGVFNEIKDSTLTRKDFALEAIKHGDISGILFAMYDNKPFDEIIWKKLRPSAEKPWKEEV